MAGEVGVGRRRTSHAHCTSYLQRELMTNRKDSIGRREIATPASRIWTLEDTWGFKRAPPARTGKTRDLLRLSFSVSGNGDVTWYLWQQGTTLTSEHPSEVPPPCNVQLAKWNDELDAAGPGPREALNKREFQAVCTRIGLPLFV